MWTTTTPTPQWDFGTSKQYPVLKYGGHNIYRQGRPRPDPEPEEYVAPPIVYNLNIRSNVRCCKGQHNGLVKFRPVPLDDDQIVAAVPAGPIGQ